MNTTILWNVRHLLRNEKNLLPDVCTRQPNIHKFNNLFSSENVTTFEKLCRFIKIVMAKVPPG
jgi:hypothetical protein